MTRSLLQLDQFLPYRLSHTANLVSEAVAGAYEALFGLRIAEWRLVAVAAENPDGITPQAIGTRTRMDKVTVSRAASALTGRGLMARRPNGDDRRSHLLALTGDGWALHAAIVPRALELEAQIFAGFSADDIARFETMLRRIDAAVLAGTAARP